MYGIRGKICYEFMYKNILGCMAEPNPLVLLYTVTVYSTAKEGREGGREGLTFMMEEKVSLLASVAASFFNSSSVMPSTNAIVLS